MIKQYLQTAQKEPVYLEMWQQALDGIRKHLIVPTRKANLQFVAELPFGIGGPLSPKMDHLACFLPGSIALGATNGLTESEARKLPTWNSTKRDEMKLARELMKTCVGMYMVTDTGLAPEIAWFHTLDASIHPHTGHKMRSWPRSHDNLDTWRQDYRIKPLDAHNLQRPETVESLFLMWRITRDPTYREWGWTIFKAFQKHSLLENGNGYTSLDNVNKIPPPRRNNMESFWLVSLWCRWKSCAYIPNLMLKAETLKYLYLLFSPDDLLPLTEVVFNTEAHVLPILKQDRFKTGWQRRPRLN